MRELTKYSDLPKISGARRSWDGATCYGETEPPGRHGPGFFVAVRHHSAVSAKMVIPARRHQSARDRQPPGYRLLGVVFNACPALHLVDDDQDLSQLRCEVRHAESVVIRAAEMCLASGGTRRDTSFPADGVCDRCLRLVERASLAPAWRPLTRLSVGFCLLQTVPNVALG